MERSYIRDVTALRAYAIASLTTFLKNHKMPLVGKQGDPIASEVAELEARYSQKHFSLADVVLEVQNKRKVTQAFSPFNLSAIRTVATEISINHDSVTTVVNDKKWNLSTIFGTVNWADEKTLKTDVNIGRALLAQEMSQDVRVSNGKVAPVHRGATATFGDMVSEAQVAQAASSVGRIKMSSGKIVKGHEASDMIYDAIMPLKRDEMLKEMSDFHSYDPDFVRERSVYKEVEYKAWARREGRDEEVDVVGKVREEGGGLRPVKTPLGEMDIYELVRQHDTHVGSTKAGMGQMMTDFFYGAPLDGLYLRCLRALTMVKQLKDTESPVLLETSDMNIGLFVFENVNRAVGIRTEHGSDRSVIDNNIKAKHMFEVGNNAKGLSEEIIHVFLKPVSAPLDAGMAETLSGAKDILSIKLVDAPKRCIFPAHVWGLKDFLLSGKSTTYELVKGKEVFKIQVAPNLMLNKHKFTVSSMPGMLANPVSGIQANLILKMFIVNSVSFRYHKLSFSEILKSEVLNKTGMQLNVYPLAGVSFKLLAAKKKGSLTAVLLEEGIVGGGLKRAIDEEFAAAIKGELKKVEVEAVAAAPREAAKPKPDEKVLGKKIALED